MTFPIQLLPLPAPDGAGAGTTPVLPPGAGAAAIATEFRHALSSALGTRPRRARVEGEVAHAEARPSPVSRAEPAGQAGSVPAGIAVEPVPTETSRTEISAVRTEISAVLKEPEARSPGASASPTRTAPTSADAAFLETALSDLHEGDRKTEDLRPGAPPVPDASGPVQVAPMSAPALPAPGITADVAPDRGEQAMPRESAAVVPEGAGSHELERRAAALLADPSVPIKDRALLRPEFSTRLDRVIERMET
jgi:hypothetical protein